MITEFIIDAALLIVQAIDAIIPDFTLPYSDDLLDGAEYVGDKLGMVNTAFPVSEGATFLGWATALFLLPVVLPYTIVKFIYAHLPVIGRS